MRKSKVFAWVAAAAMATSLAACSSAEEPLEEQPNAGESAQHAGETENAQTPAVPAASPAADSPLGAVHQGQGKVLDVSTIGLNSASENVAVLREGALSIAPIEELAQGQGEETQVPKSCSKLTPSAKGVALTCDNELLEFDEHGKKVQEYALEKTPTVGTVLGDGRVAVGYEDSNKLYISTADADGQLEEDESFIVSRSIDRLAHFNNDEGAERLAVIDRDQTSVSDINIADDSIRGALRIGQGVGQVSPGRGSQGVMIASDTVLGQIEVFTLNDVVRQVQSAPTEDSPWAVLWDAKRNLGWVSTTSDNRVTAYSIDSGTPEVAAQFQTIADVRFMVDSPDGGLLLIGKDGETQLVSAAELEAALDRGVDGAEDYPVFHED